MRSKTPSLGRVMLLVYGPFLVLALLSRRLEQLVDRGLAQPAAIGLAAAVFGLLLGPLGRTLESMVFDVQRPWLSGQLHRWQSLVLPYSSGAVLARGFGLEFAGGAYLVGAPPGGNTANILALMLCASGGALVGFGLARLAVAVVLIPRSGLWGPRRSAWLAAAAAVAIASLASGIYAVLKVLPLSSAV